MFLFVLDLFIYDYPNKYSLQKKNRNTQIHLIYRLKKQKKYLQKLYFKNG